MPDSVLHAHSAGPSARAATPAAAWSPWLERIGREQRREALRALEARRGSAFPLGVAAGAPAADGVRLFAGDDSWRALSEAIDTASRAGEAWLLHPSCRGLTRPASAAPEGGELAQLVFWVLGHMPGCRLEGRVWLEKPLRFWTPVGPVLLGPGDHDLHVIETHFVEPEADPAVPLDLSWDVLGPAAAEAADMPSDWRGPPIEEVTDEVREPLIDDLKAYFGAFGFLGARLPAASAWIDATTQVCLPIQRQPDGKFKSASRIDIPGAVFLDLRTDRHLLLEAMVHETAHLSLFMEEYVEPLIVPGYVGAYVSALRPEPRPLRGIFLAYHALAYMAALYRDLEETGVGGDYARDARTIREKLAQSRETLNGETEHLTDRGRSLLRRTERVCDYGYG